MKTITLGGKELKLKYAYGPTLKEHLLSKMVGAAGSVDVNGEDIQGSLERIEDLMLFLPEAILVGVQGVHKEYAYDWRTGEGKTEKLDKIMGLFSAEDDLDLMSLLQSVQEALTEDSFLAQLFREGETAPEVEAAAQKILQARTK